MTTEHDRLLAEGPRVAPEAPMVSDLGAVVAPVAAAPDAGIAGADEPTTAGGPAARRPRAPGAPRQSRGLARPLFGRAWLPLLLGAIVVANAGGRGYAWVIPVVLVGFAWFRIWRRR